MSSRKRKLAIIAGLIAALGVVIFIKEREYISTIEAAAGPKDEKWLFPIPLEEVGAIEVMRKGQLHRFEKDDKGTWFYHGQQDGPNATEHAHRADPLAATTILQAIAMFSRTRKEQPIPLEPGKDEFGISRPDILVMIYRAGKTDPVGRFAVGTVSPDGYSRYILPVGASEAVTIPEYQITNLMAMIDAVSKNAPTPAAAPSQGATLRR
jgi:hypothetical protein